LVWPSLEELIEVIAFLLELAGSPTPSCLLSLKPFGIEELRAA
jgi:hypothetical protein